MGREAETRGMAFRGADSCGFDKVCALFGRGGQGQAVAAKVAFGKKLKITMMKKKMIVLSIE